MLSLCNWQVSFDVLYWGMQSLTMLIDVIHTWQTWPRSLTHVVFTQYFLAESGYFNPLIRVKRPQHTAQSGVPVLLISFLPHNIVYVRSPFVCSSLCCIIYCIVNWCTVTMWPAVQVLLCTSMRQHFSTICVCAMPGMPFMWVLRYVTITRHLSL